jgi:hypothetical protein
MTAVANVKPIGSDFGNQENIVRVVYDFALDGGATGDLDLSGLAQGSTIVALIGVAVETLPVSTGAATIAVGYNGGTEFLSATGKASFVAGTFVAPTVASYLKVVTATGKLTMSIGTEVLTAGKMTFVFKTMNY